MDLHILRSILYVFGRMCITAPAAVKDETDLQLLMSWDTIFSTHLNVWYWLNSEA